jgi:hypothetical protein
MAQKTTKKATSPAFTTLARRQAKSEVIHQTYNVDTYARMVKYMNAHGLLTPQAVGRLAMSFFLSNQGY